jgi:hypothetical protein
MPCVSCGEVWIRKMRGCVIEAHCRRNEAKVWIYGVK